MSDRRLQWSLSERQLLLQLRSNYSESTISELRELLNSQTHPKRHRTDEAVKSQLARLKEKGVDGIEIENTAAYSKAQPYRRQSPLGCSFRSNAYTMFANSNLAEVSIQVLYSEGYANFVEEIRIRRP
jgi:retron-type reverse transcriptase